MTGFCDHRSLFLYGMHGGLLPSHFRDSLNTHALSILVREHPEIREELEKNRKMPPGEKKIANPLFYRYITSAFLSKTIYQRAGVRVVE